MLSVEKKLNLHFFRVIVFQHCLFMRGQKSVYIFEMYLRYLFAEQQFSLFNSKSDALIFLVRFFTNSFLYLSVSMWMVHLYIYIYI